MKPSVAIKLGVSSLLLLSLSCGKYQQQDSSSLDGHYEKFTKEKAQSFIGKQTVVPEYDPVESVVISMPLIEGYGKEDLVKAILDAGAKKVFVTVESYRSGMTTNSKSFSTLKNLLGRDIEKVELVPQAKGGDLTVWARDWAPLGALSGSDKSDGPILVDFNYYPDRPSDDVTSISMEKSLDYDRVSVPVYNEGGNFMVNSRGECLMTSRVSEANEDAYTADDMILDDDEIKQYYKDFAGCEKVTIFPRMPYEGTGHIDMWGKFLDNDTVIVGDIQPETMRISRIQGGYAESFSLRISQYLDDRTRDLQNLGYTVKRIPMPLPDNYAIRSYTNSLLVNGVALVPRYEVGFDPDTYGEYAYYDENLQSEYESEVRRAYEASGFKVKFINSDELIAYGGAIHCVTMQLPASSNL